MASLLQAIGAERLTEYFEFLDDLRESGATNMFGAGPYLREEYPGMARAESDAVLGAWMKTFGHKPAEDRVDDALDGRES